VKPVDLSRADRNIHPVLKRIVPMGKAVLGCLPKDNAPRKILTRIDFGYGLSSIHENDKGGRKTEKALESGNF
jgi:hypothetical protein